MQIEKSRLLFLTVLSVCKGFQFLVLGNLQYSLLDTFASEIPVLLVPSGCCGSPTIEHTGMLFGHNFYFESSVYVVNF